MKGRIELRTSDGNITGLDLIGDLLARTDDGAVRLNSVDGRCDVVTGDGSITLDGRFDFVRARTNDGSVTVKVLPGSKVGEAWSLMTGDGNAIVYLPDGLNADLDAESNSGHTRVDQALRIHTDGDSSSKTMLRGTIGEGGGNLRIRTVDGHIFFKRLPYKLRHARLRAHRASRSARKVRTPREARALRTPRASPNPQSVPKRWKSPKREARKAREAREAWSVASAAARKSPSPQTPLPGRGLDFCEGAAPFQPAPARCVRRMSMPVARVAVSKPAGGWLARGVRVRGAGPLIRNI